jgi:predicted nucleotidyltransferase
MKVTIEDAHILAKKFKEKSPKILGIELFGSLLRKGVGHDADFIFLVGDELAKAFWSDTSDINVRWPPELLFVRRILKKFLPALGEALIAKRKKRAHSRVSALLGFDVELFAETYKSGTKVGVWLLPSDWRIDHTLNRRAILRVADIADDRKTLLLFKLVAQVAIKIA